MSLSESVKQVISNHWSFLAEATFEPTAQGSSQATYFVYTPIRNKLSLDGSCQGDLRRCFKQKAVRPSLSIGERRNN